MNPLNSDPEALRHRATDSRGSLSTWPLVWILILGVLVVGAVYLVTRWLPAHERGEGDPDDPDRAMAVLRERYARGEVTDEEFEERRKRLLEPE